METHYTLQAIGTEMRREGYSFSRFHEGFRTYWELMFDEQIEFSEEKVQFVKKKEMKRLYTEIL